MEKASPVSSEGNAQLRARAILELRRREMIENGYNAWLGDHLPKGWSADVPHLKLISGKLDKITSGKTDRLSIFMPPRHAKTQTVTVRYPVFRLETAARPLRVLITGYNERFVRRLSRQMRNVAEPILGLSPDKSATDEWETPSGSLVMARGVGSPPTGDGFDLIVIDDPIRKREDADSVAYREKLQDWYGDDLFTRLEPGGAIILIQTRWADDDLGKYAPDAEPGRWDNLTLPALSEGEGDPLGRPEGAALWPERRDVAELLNIKAVLDKKDTRSFLALFQQRPIPAQGALFHPDKIVIEKVAPLPARFVKLCRAWDKAASPTGDWTVGVLMGYTADGELWVLDVKRDRLEPGARDRWMRGVAGDDAQSWGKGNVLQRGPVDPGAAGIVDARLFAKLMVGHQVKVVTVAGQGGKVLRAGPFASQVNAGNVKMVEGPWNVAYRDELRAFKGAPTDTDDQVDASSDAFTEVSPDLDEESEWDIYG
jgi:predicted phage terminase large subunit-like protein